MKEITVLSGKGGTGKTSITAAFASLSDSKVLCDNDVDAADLHLVVQPTVKEEHRFNSGSVAEINAELCTNCGICEESCRFNAIDKINGIYVINRFRCEGCRLCERVCPSNAVETHKNLNNKWFVSSSRLGDFVHARMGPGEENSGKLVTQIRTKAKEIALKKNLNFIINDGPPGVGCTVISALSGTNLVVLVIEPTRSGLHDVMRLYRLVKQSNIPCVAIINKYDINQELVQEIEAFLQVNTIELISKIPFCVDMVNAISEGKSIIDYNPDLAVSKTLRNAWDKIASL